MKRIIVILVLSLITLSFPPLVNADEIRMMIWHPQINTRDTEMVGKIEIFIDYLNERLKWGHITYSIVQTPEQAADYFNQYKPKIGFIDQRYWKKHGRVLSPGYPWLTANHRKKPSRPSNLFIGSEQIVPDVVSEVFLKGVGFKRRQGKDERIDLLSMLKMNPRKTAEVPLLQGADAEEEGIMKLLQSLTSVYGGLPGGSPGVKSMLVQFSTNIPEKETLKESLLTMSTDPVGREILESLRIKRFKSRRR